GVKQAQTQIGRREVETVEIDAYVGVGGENTSWVRELVLLRVVDVVEADRFSQRIDCLLTTGQDVPCWARGGSVIAAQRARPRGDGICRAFSGVNVYAQQREVATGRERDSIQATD